MKFVGCLLASSSFWKSLTPEGGLMDVLTHDLYYMKKINYNLGFICIEEKNHTLTSCPKYMFNHISW